MSQLIPYVARFADRDVAFSANPEPGPWSRLSVQGMVEEAVRNSGLTTPRQDPRSIPVEVFQVTTHAGKLHERLVRRIVVPLPLARMTSEEFAGEQASTLSRVPEEFHEVLSGMAWQRGHSSGMEECGMILEELVADLLPCIQAYAARLSKQSV